MGNENSQLSGLEIEEKCVEMTDFWKHSWATVYNDTVSPLSVFIGESLVEGPLWSTHTPLDKITKNLMLHRHPSILKYVSSWSKGSKQYLAVEQVRPLAQVLGSQSPLQVCVGLHSLLRALCFLQETARASHNNLCLACVYVTGDGSWRLGGLEHLCRLQELTPATLAAARPLRYQPALHPQEATLAQHPHFLTSGAVDKYAFSVLVQELLDASQQNDSIPFLEEFKEFCKTELQYKDGDSVGSFSSVLEHPYFSNDFIVIYSVLTELALKVEEERRVFFTELCERLRAFPQDIVARQLGALLLSRLVLLDPAARQHLLPQLLAPPHLFSGEVFRQHLVPRLLHVFCVRDAQIRLLLLTHFKAYVNYFSKEQLQNHILPELLIGIKDTNDHLVSVTLVALSELVPLLGAAVVIGGKRLKLFNDGRPGAVCAGAATAVRVDNRVEAAPRRPSTADTALSCTPELPERLSPDGGEAETAAAEADVAVPEEDLDNWSDWETEEPGAETVGGPDTPLPLPTSEPLPQVSLTAKFPRSQVLTDIATLDIKTLKASQPETEQELDYFQDMEPVIERPSQVYVGAGDGSPPPRLAAPQDTPPAEDCWGDDLSWVHN